MAKTITGTVSSIPGNKTIVVKVERRKTHPLYRKQYKETSKFMAHDEKNQAKIGDKVEIIGSRPISARKRFVLQKVLSNAEISGEALGVISVKEERKTRSTKNKDEKETVS